MALPKLSYIAKSSKRKMLTEGEIHTVTLDLMKAPVGEVPSLSFNSMKQISTINSLVDLINLRIEEEEYSSRIYLAMSIWLEHHGYAGAAKLWKSYSEEELKHAQWSYNYLLDLDIKPIVPALRQPECEFQGLPDIIMQSYEHELDITRQCQFLAQNAQANGDYMTLDFAQKFLREQVEELAKTTFWVDRLEAFGTEKVALRLLDNEMGG